MMFTQQEIEAVREAIRKAKKDMDEYRKATTPDPEKMRQPVHRFQSGRRVY